MYPTRILRQAAEQRTPLIKFIGHRSPPKAADSTPHAHPASPSSELPDSFVQYRSNAQNHGPLGHRSRSSKSSQPSPSSSSSAKSTASASSALTYGAIGSHSGQSLGSVDAPKGHYFDRSELPARFGRTPWTEAEIEAVETGGASAAA
ncbi:hypothetical protein MMC07_005828 [Pseudocyphellaria aurata]|nr:hypothetical protein [Pseudocyphellaria aurata]